MGRHLFRTMTWRVTVVVALCTGVACKEGQAPLTDEDKAGEVFASGAKVKAPLGRRKKRPATVTELYGKLAKLDFHDGNIGWALVKELEPVGAVQLYPKGDTCSFKVGDHVLARWSTSLSLTAGVIDEVHGKLAHITFVDNDVDWAVCDELKPKPEEEAGEAESGGGGGVSDDVVKCQRGCNRQCHGASNKAKCVNQCRRACR